MMAAGSGLCHVSSDWLIKDRSGSINDVVIYREENRDGDSCTTTANGEGITLQPPPGDNHNGTMDNHNGTNTTCTLKFSTNNRYVITAIDVLCDARTVEVFGTSTGYLQTVQGDRVDEGLDINRKLFMIPCSFERPVTQCTLNLVNPIHCNHIWLHSIYITIDTVSIATNASPLAMMGFPIEMTSTPTIDLSNVKDMLGDTEVSDKAKGLMNVMEMFQKNKAGSMSNPLSSLGASMMSSPGGAASSGQMAALVSMFAGLKQRDTQPSHQDFSRTETDKCTTVLSENKQTNSTDEGLNVDNQHSAPSSSNTDNQDQELTDSGTSSQTRFNDNLTKTTDESHLETEAIPSLPNTSPNGTPNTTPTPPLTALIGSVIQQSPNTSPSSNSNTTPTPPLTALIHSVIQQSQQTISDQIKAAEERIMGRMVEQITASENRIQEKLDQLLSQLSRLPGTHTIDPAKERDDT